MLEPVVALARLASYGEKNLSSIVGDILDKSWPTVSPGSRILVKPNLLLARELACASPEITAAVCGWLLDR
ncbi:MAG: hypothetical protein K2H64_08505, partial [Desulfovibrio sp.]|nr:hypothetical protein [Desulfovibrio sp.]